MNTHAVMSAYSKRELFTNGVRNAMNTGRLLYANVGEFARLETENPALGRVLAPKEVFDRPVALDVKAPSAASNPLPATSSNASRLLERANPSIGSAPAGLVGKEASRLVKDIAQQVMG